MARKQPFNYERYDFPCRPDCPDRCADPNCHDTCERYLAARKKRDAQNAARFAKHEAESYTIDSVRDRQDKNAKQRRNFPRSKYNIH